MSIFIFFILAVAFNLASIDHPIHSQKATIFIFMFLITALLAIYLTISFLRQWKNNNPYISRLTFISAIGQEIGYSIYYDSNTNNTVIILLAGTEIAQINLFGLQDKYDVYKYIKKILLKYHGKLSNFPVYKKLTISPL